MSFWSRFKKNFSSLGGAAGFLVNPVGSVTTALGSAGLSSLGFGDSLADQWDMFKNGNTNKANMAMNKANIDFQKAYNQQIWNREDTSYQRTLKDMAAVGMSPLAMGSVNGAGGSANAPNYMFGWQDKGAGQAFSEIANFASQLASIQNLTAQNSLIGAQSKLTNAQADEKEITNFLLKDKLNYFKANGFVEGMSDKEKLLMLGLGAFGPDNPFFSNGDTGLTFNNIANSLRQGIKDGSVQKSITSLLGDVGRGVVDSFPQLTLDSAKIGKDLVTGTAKGLKESAKGIYEEFVPDGAKEILGDVGKGAKAVGSKFMDVYHGGKNFVKDLFKPKPGSKKFSKNQADARKSRRGN